MRLRHDLKVKITTARAQEYVVAPLEAEHDPLDDPARVAFIIYTARSPFSFQDHLTPDEADALAAGLQTAAARARGLAGDAVQTIHITLRGESDEWNGILNGLSEVSGAIIGSASSDSASWILRHFAEELDEDPSK